MATAPRTTLDTLQAGRALAALAVVCFHYNQYGGSILAPLPSWLSRPMAFGYLGVDFFFVLSGFIIYYTNAARVGDPGWDRSYAVKRLSRIYLPYWPVGLAAAAGYVLAPTLGAGTRHWGWFSTVTLLPAGPPPALAVAWTLQHEILFYAIAFVLLRRRLVFVGSIAWAALILLLVPLGLWRKTPGLSLLDLEFLFGIAAAWYCLKRGQGREAWLAAAGSLTILLWFSLPGDLPSAPFGLGLALLLPAIVRAELAGKLGAAGKLRVVGNASYAIYLIHLPLLSAVVRLCSSLNPFAAAALALIASVAAGIAYHRLFERHVLDWARRRLSGCVEAEALQAQGGEEQAEKNP
jgi:exopolysaccharide production protein ExoZ